MDPAAKNEVIGKLSRMIQGVEDRYAPGDSRVIATGWEEVDKALSGGLGMGVHEFALPIADCQLPIERPNRRGARKNRQWAIDNRQFPICVLVHLAHRAAMVSEGHVVWIGRGCWADATFLGRAGLLGRSLFVDAGSAADRLWAIELAMRCPAVAAVVADGGGLRLPATRRLELAAKDVGAMVLLARPAQELETPSAAMTRWALWRRLSDSLHPAWTLELKRCKGRQHLEGGRWLLEWTSSSMTAVSAVATEDRTSSGTVVSTVG